MTIYFADDWTTLYVADVLDGLAELPDGSVHCCVTSPPYWGLRDYGTDGQLGLESTPEEYVENMVKVFREVRRVLRDDGTLWLNLGDSYYNYRPMKKGDNRAHAFGTERDCFRGLPDDNSGTKRGRVVAGLKEKDLVGIPWRVAFALQADGWWLRSDIIWAKPNPMPESVRDRPTKAHEYIFLLTKAERYFYDADAVAEPSTGQNGTRNRRTVWTITTKPYPEAHFAVFPPELPEICIKAGCPEGGTVLDPFAGAGTTLMVALRLGRKSIGIEINGEYAKLSMKRIVQRPFGI